MGHPNSIFVRLASAIAVVVFVPAFSPNTAVLLIAQTPVGTAVSVANTSAPLDSKVPVPAAARISSSYGKLPISFEINQGQTDKTVQFLARGNGYTLFLTPGEAVLSLHASRPATAVRLGRPAVTSAPSSYVHLQLIGSNTHAAAEGVDPLPGKTNYLIGSDPSRWHRDVPTFSKVRYNGVYPGVDLVYYGNQEGRLEHDFVVAPGANPDVIAIDLGSKSSPVRSHDGALTVSTRNGNLTLLRPVAYQEIGGVRKAVPATYELAGNSRIRFHLGAYDRIAPLVIDPVLVYTAEFGGTGVEDLVGQIEIAVDSSGQVYLTGFSTTNDFPVVNAYQSTWTPSGTDSAAAIVAKINAAGTAFVYSTYLGGPATNDSFYGPTGIATDNVGNAYLVGSTQGSGFPTTSNAYQPTWVGSSTDLNAFLTVLNPQGDSLIYSTYFGGKGWGTAFGVALDPSENIYIMGLSQGTGFPQLHSIATKGAIFVAKFSRAGSLEYSTLFGSGYTVPSAIAVDASGAAYITGTVTNLPSGSVPITEHAFGRTCSIKYGSCAFVSKVDPTGASLDYSTYLVGQGSTGGNGIAVDSSGEAYVGGVVNNTGAGFPTTSHAFRREYLGGDSDGFVTKFNATGSGVVWSTFVGGSSQDWVSALALDQHRNVYIAGYTYSTDVPLKDPIDSSVNRPNVANFVMTLDGSLSDIVYYSTYYPANITSIAVDPQLNLFLSGTVYQNSPPVTPGSLDAGPVQALFVTKLVIEDDLALAVSASPNPVATGGLLTYTIAVTSKGPDFGYNVRMSDPIPAGTTFVSYDAGGGKCTAPAVGGTGAFHCELLQLKKGDTWDVKLTVHVNAATGSTLSNTATTVSNTQDFTPANNTGTITTHVD